MTLKQIFMFDVNRVLNFDLNRILRWDLGRALSRPISTLLLKALAGWSIGALLLALFVVWSDWQLSEGAALLVMAASAACAIGSDLTRIFGRQRPEREG